jgi:DNA-binding transcriptional MocR family regulator
MKTPREVTLEREQRCWTLRQQCWTTRRIAAELGIDQSTVVRALDRVHKRALKELTETARRAKLEQLAQLDRIADEAMEAWERSKKEATSRAVTAGRAEVTPRGEKVDLPDLVVTQTRDRDGDPAHLHAAMKALSDQRAILGIEAPKGVDVTSGGEPVQLFAGIDLERV